MKNQSTLSPTFWSGVINYIRTSAHSAEVPVQQKNAPAVALDSVMVFKTSVKGLAGRKKIAAPLTELLGKQNWTIDLEDEDKVLRVVAVQGLQQDIVGILDEAGFGCELMPY